MPKLIDERGKKYGKLTVLCAAADCNTKLTRDYYWRCRCDCGGLKDVRGSKLRAGQTKSCGCLKRAYYASTPDLMGQKFGQLEVIAKLPSRAYNTNRAAQWLCLCSCGRKIAKLGVQLRRADGPKSCGCTRQIIYTSNFNQTLTK